MKLISSGQSINSELGWSIYVVENNQQLIGFIESSLKEKIEVCDASPVGYVEGWYVDENHRKMGVGKLLTQAAEEWAKSKGCSYMGSDVKFHNEVSLKVHQRLGYQVVGTDDECHILLKNI